MSLDHLWAGWRASYIDTVTNDGPPTECLFCTLGDADLDAGLVVARDDTTFAVLNAYPYTSGHLLVVPRRHEPELEGLDAVEASGLMATVQRAITSLKGAYAPDGVNVGINLGRAAGAGVLGHVHVHVLPRWGGDTNFMTTVAEARVLPESLDQTLERLRAAWPT